MTTNPFYAFAIGMLAMALLISLFGRNKYWAMACVLVAVLAGFVGTFHDAP